MPDKKDIIEPLDASFDEVVDSIMPRIAPEEITNMKRKINRLAQVRGGKEITPGDADGILRMAETGERMLILPVSVWEMGACGFSLPLLPVPVRLSRPRDL